MQGARPLGRGFDIGGTARQPLGDAAVVVRGVGIGLGGEFAAQRGLGTACSQRGFDARVVGRVHHHADARVVLGGRTQHRRATDVDVLDCVLVAAVGPGHGGFERIQVHHQQVDWRDAVFGHHVRINRLAAQQAAVHARVQGLDAAVHDLGKAGELGHIANAEPGLAQGAGGTAGGQQFNA